MRLSDPSFAPIWLKAVEEFNSEQFFECHETLEAFWLVCSDPIEKEFLQGIIQTAAAMIKLKEKNYKGLKSLIGRALPKLLQAEENPSCIQLVDLNLLINEINKIKTNPTDQKVGTLNIIKIIKTNVEL